MNSDWIHRLFENYLSWLFALFLATWGGAVQYATRVREGEQWSWPNFLLDLVICSFFGILAYFACLSTNIEGPYMALIIAMSGHQGAKGAKFWVRIYEGRAGGPR